MTDVVEPPEKSPGTPPRLRDQVRDQLRLKHYSLLTNRLMSAGSNDTLFSTANGTRPRWANLDWWLC
jgi:hypothetical protein